LDDAQLECEYDILERCDHFLLSQFGCYAVKKIPYVMTSVFSGNQNYKPDKDAIPKNILRMSLDARKTYVLDYFENNRDISACRVTSTIPCPYAGINEPFALGTKRPVELTERKLLLKDIAHFARQNGLKIESATVKYRKWKQKRGYLKIFQKIRRFFQEYLRQQPLSLHLISYQDRQILCDVMGCQSPTNGVDRKHTIQLMDAFWIKSDGIYAFSSGDEMTLVECTKERLEDVLENWARDLNLVLDLGLKRKQCRLKIQSAIQATSTATTQLDSIVPEGEGSDGTVIE
jgi:hypothetical protein